MQVINRHKDIESYGEPINYGTSNIKFWEETTKELIKNKEHSLVNKAKTFLDNSCIMQIDNSNWKCNPLEGYNTKTYEIRSTKEGLSCNCQGFKKKLLEFNLGKQDIKPLCSHIVAVKQFCFLEQRKSI